MGNGNGKVTGIKELHAQPQVNNKQKALKSSGTSMFKQVYVQLVKVRHVPMSAVG